MKIIPRRTTTAAGPRRARLAAGLALATATTGLFATTPSVTPADAVLADPATSSGRYADIVEWVEWGNRNNEVVLQNGQSSKTVTMTHSIGGQTLEVACTVDNLEWLQPQQTGENKTNTGRILRPPLVAYVPGSWAGDALDDLYNIGGTGYSVGTNPEFPRDFRNNNTMAIGLGNPNPSLGNSTVSENESNGARMAFDVSCEATLDDRPVPLEGLVFADAEASSGPNHANSGANNGPEWLMATPLGAGATTWHLLEQERTCTQASQIATWPSGSALRVSVDNQECVFQNGHQWPRPDPNARGPITVAFLENNDHQHSVSARLETQGRGYSAVAAGYVLATDFGDAPARYGKAGALLGPQWLDGVIRPGRETNLSTAPVARQGFPQRLILGESVDAEQEQRHSADARGDDSYGGASDEDGLVGTNLADADHTLPMNLFGAQAAQTYTLEDVTCYGPQTGSAHVYGWIDWNGNGTFDEDERSTRAQCTAGGPHRVNLEWQVPAHTNPDSAHTYLRLRLAEDRAEAAAPTGLSVTGEVEDHRLNLPARVRVDKTWIVNGEEYDHGTQLAGLDAALTLTPSPADGPAWGKWGTGHRVGDEVKIGEVVDFAEAVAGCTFEDSTLTGDGLPADGVDLRKGTTTETITLPRAINRYQITNEVTCSQNLTLVKEVDFGDRSPQDWTLSATGPVDALPGHHEEPTGTTVAVTDSVPYALTEQGPQEYVPTAEGWQCLDDRTGREIGTDDDTVTLRPGQDATCTVTNTTARLTLLKVVEGGAAQPADWTLSAAPTTDEYALDTHETTGADEADAAPTWEVRPGHPYRLTERPTDEDADTAYTLDRVEVSLDDGRTWKRVDADTAVSVPAGTHATYRFVNQSIPHVSLPQTGGRGRDVFLATGGLVLLGAIGLTLWRARRTE